MPSKPIIDKAFQGLKACFWQADAECCSLVLAEPVPSELSDLANTQSDWKENVFPPDLPRVNAWIAACAKGEIDSSIDYRVVSESRGIVWIRHWLLAKPTSVGKRHVRAKGLIIVLDEQKLLEEECLRICERERTSIGQELHDDICQIMAGLSCMMDVLGKQIQGVRPDLHSLLDELSSQIYGGMERTRALAHGLVPAKLVNLGLERALVELARQTSVSRQVQASAVCLPDLPAHSSEQTLQLYRIAQEAVSNSIKHGRASRIEISLTRSGPLLKLRIKDNGKGLPKKSNMPQGIGLHVMQFRTAILGGTFSIKSVRGGGVAVEVTYSAPLGSHGISAANT